jgi:uncharacterized radical SAM superfamily protein
MKQFEMNQLSTASGTVTQTSWLKRIQSIEDLEDAEFDATLVADMERSAHNSVSRMVRFSTPTFKEYESSDEIRYNRFYPVIEKLKRDHPNLRIAIHTALTDETGAREMEAAGVDIAMLDVIGAEETIRDVYHLDRPVEDFEQTLAAICATSMQVSPHIVIGLHYGRIVGEENALDIIAQYNTHALVLVVIMPFYAKPGTFVTPATSDVGRIFMVARERLMDRQLLLGCARPPGMHKRVTDAYAVMAGLDGIAFPADGAVAVADSIGRQYHQAHACCSVKLGSGSLTSPPVSSCAA